MRFVLIHGTGMGAWCWDRVIPVLRALGHDAIAIDLPGHGEKLDRPASGFAERSHAINDVLEPGDVLVGHSAGGYDITIAADRDPGKVGHLIYLAAGLPLEGRAIGDAMHGVGEIDPETGAPMVIALDPEILRHAGQDANGRMIWLDPAGPRALNYHDSDDATADWAYARSAQPASFDGGEIVRVPRFWQADLPRSFILCTRDRVLPVPRARLFCRRLGVEPLEIDASHCPMFNKPDELARLLVRAVGTRPVGPLMPGNPG